MSERLDLTFLGEPVRKKGKQLFFNCPFHEDNEGHLGIDTRRGIYHCFKCNCSGKIKELEQPLSEFKNKIEIFLNGSPEENKKQQEQLNFPEGIRLLKEDSGLPYRYMKDRDVTVEEIKKYDIRYCNSGTFMDRIIIPIYTNNNLSYYVGRTYLNKEPKYMNAPVPKAGNIFKTFNKKVDKAIICEGIFDALKIGKLFPAISILGKVLNGSEQIVSILKYTKEAYVMLDSDANKDGFIAANLLNYYIPTHVMFIKGKKDAGEMTIKELKEILPK